jgi:microcystin-dependent protein
LVPLGTVLPFAGISPPTGWLLCDGTDQPPQAYPELYDLIGNTYGGTFKMPDLTDVTMSKTNNTAINYIIKY